MPNDSHHVVTNPNGGWDIKRGGGQRASAHYETKQEAVSAAITLCKNQETELFVHNLDGKIGYKNSYGGDPSDIPG